MVPWFEYILEGFTFQRSGVHCFCVEGIEMVPQEEIKVVLMKLLFFPSRVRSPKGVSLMFLLVPDFLSHPLISLIFQHDAFHHDVKQPRELPPVAEPRRPFGLELSASNSVSQIKPPSLKNMELQMFCCNHLKMD